MSLLGKITGMFDKPYGAAGPEQVQALIDQGALLLDVRELREWAAGHAPQARHIPLGQVVARIKELPEGRRIVTVCRSGARSRRAAALLASQGRTVTNLSGGMTAWAAAGLPVVAKGGRPGTIV